MNKSITISRAFRTHLVELLDSIPIEKLTETPPKFNNNIWWNIAHVAVTQQLLVYKLSGLPMNLPTEIIEKYSKGSKPCEDFVPQELTLIRESLTSLIDQTEKDYSQGVFKDFNEYKTSANVWLKNVEDAMSFNVFHEGIHLGSILALKRAIGIS